MIVDPPSFSSVGNLNAAALDIQRDHPELLRGVAEVLEPGGTILFSTNHQRFEPRLDGFSRRFEIREISQQVQAEDFARRAAHRCFLLRSRA